ncbi:OmpA family protein [Pseudotenacibaculum haliotis]|uniref:OmpA family protein n=1 Tax=Pseudotenacibaculum haliotis TaxID=1862138 RepID=A0ABW5LZ04_9FLAO
MRKTITFILALSVGVVFAQSKRTAEKYFNNFEYVKSAELYEKIYQKGDSSFLVLSRLGDSYYFNAISKKSEFWYEKLFTTIPEEEIPAEYYFKYAQSLKSNKNYKRSDDWLRKFRAKSLEDSRGKEIEGNKNYLNELTKERKKIVTLNNVSINTAYSDFGGFISGDSLIFSSTSPGVEKGRKLYKWNNQPFINVYVGAQKKLKGNKEKEYRYDVTEARQMLSINTKYHESSVIITKDGNTKYFTRNNYLKKLRADNKRTVHLKLYKAEKIDGRWDNITELPFNSNDYSIGHPALSNDEKTLYFVSDMPGGIGQTDLYKIQILEDGSFGEPENLGKTINTEGREMFPFVAADNTLYFSSDGHLGLGLLDVFASRQEEGTYKAIDNLGSPFNSPKDDFAFVIDDTNAYGYVSSNREGGKGDDDIYSFTIREPEPPCMQNITGIVKDKKFETPLKDAKIVLTDEQGKIVAEQITKVSGEFAFTLPCNKLYKVTASKQYYKPDSNEFKTTEKRDLILNLDFNLGVIDEFTYNDRNELMIRIDPIFFDYNKSNIRPDAAKELDRIVSIMNRFPKLIIESTSHTDARGKARYNESLSDRRAKSTVRYIISKGISEDRIIGKGYGESKLTNNCVDNDSHSNRVKCTEEEHQANRRSEFLITNISELGIGLKVVTQVRENKAKQNANSHVVKEGDTLFSIAKFYGITVDQLKKLNKLSGNKISIGQTLKIN